MKICIIGCGNMGSGIAQRLSKEHALALHDHDVKGTAELAKTIGAKSYSKAVEAVQDCEIVILAVKPQNLSEIATHIASSLTPKKLLISILSGITMHTLRRYFGDIPIVRMMPNLPLLHGKGVIGLAENPELPNATKNTLDKLLKPLGFVHWLPENKMDALNSLTGSGPAFVFVLIEAMIDAAIAMGFSAHDGKQYVYEMLEGSLTMLQETGQHPAELKWKVTSPAGTTIAGLQEMEEHGVRGCIMNTFIAAYQRAAELGAV